MTPVFLLALLLQPCRLIDTRLTNTPLKAQETRTVQAIDSKGVGTCNLESSVQGLFVNVTVIPQEPLGFLTLWPSGPLPLVSNLNATDGQIRSNFALVGLSNGSFNVYATQRTHLIIDVAGTLKGQTEKTEPPLPYRTVNAAGCQYLHWDCSNGTCKAVWKKGDC